MLVPPSLGEFRDCRVLVVDDHESNVALLSALLRRGGIRTVATTTDPREVAWRVAEFDPDLVLLDLHMPQMEGLVVLDQLAVQAAGAYRPVLILTGDTSRTSMREALEHGAADFITKPFDTEEVLLRVGNLLRTRVLYETLRRHNVELRDLLVGPRGGAALEDESVTRERIQGMISEPTLSMVLQPVVDLTDHSVIGCEALSRFPGEPVVGPAVWFSDARSVGLGIELELVAIRAALEIRQQLPDAMFLAINASPELLLSGALAELLPAEICASMVLELTEHSPVDDYSAIQRVLGPLRARGLRLAVDDAGSGYAGFRHLLGLAPNIVKLDLSLIRGIDSDPTRRALTAALVSFAGDVNVELIAEGVETEAERDTLLELGVTWAQGFLLARPAPVHELLPRSAE